MSNNNQFLDPLYESLVISFNIDNNRISSTDLRYYLEKFETLIDSINLSLNHNNIGGYDTVSIDVLAFEHGSFVLPLSICKIFTQKNLEKLRKITENPTAAIIIGEVVVMLLTSNHYEKSETIFNEPYSLENRVLLQDSNIAKAVKDLSILTIENDSIDSFSISYKIANGDEKKITITKSQLHKTKYTMEDCIEKEYQSNKRTESLEIISPDYREDGYIWKFLYNGEIQYFVVRDYDFLKRVSEQRIAFRRGDRIDVEMTTVGYGENTDYYITKVLNY